MRQGPFRFLSHSVLVFCVAFSTLACSSEVPSGKTTSGDKSSRILTPAEASFLMQVGEKIKNVRITSRLKEIAKKLSASPDLEPADLFFMIELSKHIDNQNVRNGIVQIYKSHSA